VKKKELRGNFIVNVQAVIKDETGIKPSFKQIDGYVGDSPRDLKPGSPPWMNLEHPVKMVKLN
jgi:hypothetical protein